MEHDVFPEDLMLMAVLSKAEMPELNPLAAVHQRIEDSEYTY